MGELGLEVFDFWLEEGELAGEGELFGEDFGGVDREVGEGCYFFL